MKAKSPKPVDIVDGVVARLKRVDLPAAEIARAAGVKESWLRMFMRGEIPNPGVRTFQQVVDYLDGVGV